MTNEYDSDLPADPHREVADEVLKSRGYTPDSTTELTKLKGRDNMFEYRRYDKGPVNSSIVYDQDTGKVEELSVNIPEGEPFSSDLNLPDIDPESAGRAIEYLQNEERVNYLNDSGFVQTEFEAQETPEETAELLNKTAEAVETVADIRAVLG